MNVNIPKRRFKGFSEDWEQEKLKNISTVSSCKRIYKNETHELGEIPFYKIGTIGKKPDSYITREIFENYKQNYDYPDYGDTIITASGSIGRLFQCQGEEAYFQDSNLVWLNFKLEMNKDYTYYYLNRIRWAVEGTTITRLYNKNILSSIFKYPNLEEQKKIAKLLNTIDKTISLHKRKFEKLKQLQKSYLNESIFSESKCVPKRRFKGFTNDWEQRELKEIGKDYSGLSGKTKKDFGHGESLYVPYKNIFNNHIVDVNNLEKVNVESKQNKVSYGDILFTISSEIPEEVGMSSVMGEDIENLYLNSFSFGLRPHKETHLDIIFSSYLFRTPTFRKKMYILAQGISRYNISKTNVMRLVVELPSFNEQKKIGEILYKLESMI